jgi:hypothetical protein
LFIDPVGDFFHTSWDEEVGVRVYCIFKPVRNARMSKRHVI